MRSCCLSLGEVSIGTELVESFVISHDDMLAFAKLSGDFNELHTDDAFSKGKGFEGVVVYGALIIAQISRLLGMRLPGRDGIWAGLKISFRTPLYVGQTAQLVATVSHVSQATGMIGLKFQVLRDGHAIASGSTESMLAPA